MDVSMLTYAMYCSSFKIPDVSSQPCACQHFRYVFQMEIPSVTLCLDKGWATVWIPNGFPKMPENDKIMFNNRRPQYVQCSPPKLKLGVTGKPGRIDHIDLYLLCADVSFGFHARQDTTNIAVRHSRLTYLHLI